MLGQVGAQHWAVVVCRIQSNGQRFREGRGIITHWPPIAVRVPPVARARSTPQPERVAGSLAVGRRHSSCPAHVTGGGGTSRRDDGRREACTRSRPRKCSAESQSRVCTFQFGTALPCRSRARMSTSHATLPPNPQRPGSPSIRDYRAVTTRPTPPHTPLAPPPPL